LKINCINSLLPVILANSRRGTKRRWSEEEDSEFKRVFSEHLKQSKAATGEELETAHSNPVLRNRSVAQMRVRIHNFINKKQKMKLSK
jgi:hypothetical protein